MPVLDIIPVWERKDRNNLVYCPDEYEILPARLPSVANDKDLSLICEKLNKTKLNKPNWGYLRSDDWKTIGFHQPFITQNTVIYAAPQSKGELFYWVRDERSKDKRLFFWPRAMSLLQFCCQLCQYNGDLVKTVELYPRDRRMRAKMLETYIPALKLRGYIGHISCINEGKDTK